jgi:hypothetical protein
MPIIEGDIADRLVDTAIQTLIAANTMAGDRVYEIRTWSMRPELFSPAALMVSTPHETKQSQNRGVPEFNTLVTLLIVGRVFVGTIPDEDLSKTLRRFKCEIENALLGDTEFMRPLQQFQSIETMLEIDSEGRSPFAELKMALTAEVFQIYEPNVSVPITQINGTLTAPSGDTYAKIQVIPV